MRPATFDHLVSKKRPVTKTVSIVLDPELADEHAEAKEAQGFAANKAAARPADTDAQVELFRAEQRLEAVEARMRDEDAVADFTFRSVGRAAYDALVGTHQPTASQRAQAKSLGMGEIAWNPDTFPPALVALCLSTPKLTEEEVGALWASDDWNQAELAVLLQAAVEVNGTRRTVDLGKDWRKTPSSEPSSTTALNGASPTVSS
jgi:hypothetical protein